MYEQTEYIFMIDERKTMNNATNYFMSILRNKTTNQKMFRTAAHHLAHILALETMKQIQYSKTTITTPLNVTIDGYTFEKDIVLVPILRSGIALLHPFLHYFPQAQVGFMGLKRDEKTAIAHRYYENIPPIESDDIVIILDPMLATGGTALDTLRFLQEKNVTQKQILFANIICAPEGAKVVKSKFPDIRLISLATDERLNDEKFILPGIGDFGDRYFGTE